MGNSQQGQGSTNDCLEINDYGTAKDNDLCASDKLGDFGAALEGKDHWVVGGEDKDVSEVDCCPAERDSCSVTEEYDDCTAEEIGFCVPEEHDNYTLMVKPQGTQGTYCQFDDGCMSVDVKEDATKGRENADFDGRKCSQVNSGSSTIYESPNGMPNCEEVSKDDVIICDDESKNAYSAISISEGDQVSFRCKRDSNSSIVNIEADLINGYESHYDSNVCNDTMNNFDNFVVKSNFYDCMDNTMPFASVDTGTQTESYSGQETTIADSMEGDEVVVSKNTDKHCAQNNQVDITGDDNKLIAGIIEENSAQYVTNTENSPVTVKSIIEISETQSDLSVNRGLVKNEHDEDSTKVNMVNNKFVNGTAEKICEKTDADTNNSMDIPMKDCIEGNIANEENQTQGRLFVEHIETSVDIHDRDSGEMKEHDADNNDTSDRISADNVKHVKNSIVDHDNDLGELMKPAMSQNQVETQNEEKSENSMEQLDKKLPKDVPKGGKDLCPQPSSVDIPHTGLTLDTAERRFWRDDPLYANFKKDVRKIERRIEIKSRPILSKHDSDTSVTSVQPEFQAGCQAGSKARSAKYGFKKSSSLEDSVSIGSHNTKKIHRVPAKPASSPEQDDWDNGKFAGMTVEEAQNSDSKRKKFREKTSHLEPFIPKDMQVFDLDHDGKVDEREFVTIAALNDNLCGKQTISSKDPVELNLAKLAYHMAVYKEMFDIVDENLDGCITADEILLLLTTAYGAEAGFGRTISQYISQVVDKDGSGRIDFVDFLTFIPFFLQVHVAMLTRPVLVEDIEKARRAVRIIQDAHSSDTASLISI